MSNGIEETGGINWQDLINKRFIDSVFNWGLKFLQEIGIKSACVLAINIFGSLQRRSNTWKVCDVFIQSVILNNQYSFQRVSYVTAIFPYIVIITLIIRGATLPGAYKGIEFYILKINTEKLITLQVFLMWIFFVFKWLFEIFYSFKTWIDATTQVFIN